MFKHYFKLVYINDGPARSFSFLQNCCCFTASSLHLFLWILNELILGIGKNHVKGEGTKRGNRRNRVNAPMTDIGIVIIGRIGTTEIVTGTRKEKDTGVGMETEYMIVIETKVEIVVVTMSVIVIALERGRVKETMMLKTITMIVGGLVIGNLIMIRLNRNMRGTDMVRGRRTMITLNQRMIMGGMNSLSMGISIQTKTKTLSLMSVIEVGASMIIWMSRTTMTVMTNVMTVVMTNMIEWRMMITNMSMQHRSYVKGREQEIWSMSIKDWRGHFLGSTSTKAAGTSQLVLLLVRFIQFLFSGV
jgi:hypothetical protein